MYKRSRTEYDDEPVHYCRRCHSLSILWDETQADGDWDGSYCKECGSTDIGTCDIDEWVEEEERREEQRKRREWRK